MKNWSIKTSLVLIPMTFIVSAYSASNEISFVPAEGSSLSTSLSMNATNLESDHNNAKLFGVNIGVDYSWKLNDNFSIDLDTAVGLEKGSSNTNKSNNEYEANNSISLKEAKLTYTPIESVNLSVGALKQDYIDAPMLLSSSAFLGAREEISLNFSIFNLTLGAQQVVPNNKNVSERLGDVEEGSPVFFNEFVDLRAKQELGSVGVRIQHYAFDKLSSSVASTSHKLGNTPVGPSGNNEFISSFIGWHYGVDGELVINNNLSLNTKYNLLVNNSAKDNHNTGTLMAVGSKYKYNDQIFSVTLESFEIESDAAVAYYNSRSYGHTNKKGQRVSLSYENEAHDFNVGGSFSSNEVIDKSNFNQSDEKVITIKFGKSYDLF